eukprot:TRINITY_DN31996_c0_g1_i1.p1 TRINITY_DN31996_c0_g1~~TRINITY_DN31996_c0_g1_i1.p1  ORF type:complete len:573 (+),score=41.69 TRINITY_DN31996_c0_g1_i1:73-1791(+)
MTPSSRRTSSSMFFAFWIVLFGPLCVAVQGVPRPARRISPGAPLSVLTFNIWNEGGSTADGVHRIALGILKAVNASDPNGPLIVGLSEVRNLNPDRYDSKGYDTQSKGDLDVAREEASVRNSLPGITPWRFTEELAKILNRLETAQNLLTEETNATEKQSLEEKQIANHWHAGAPVDNADVGLLYRNPDVARSSSGEKIPSQSSSDRNLVPCDLSNGDKSQEQNLSFAIWPYSYLVDRGSIAAWCLGYRGDNYLVAMAHLDYKEYYLDYLKPTDDEKTDPWHRCQSNTTDFALELTSEVGHLRHRQIAAFLDSAKALKLQKKISGVLLMGDLNSPSHIDWIGYGGGGMDIDIDLRKRCQDKQPSSPGSLQPAGRAFFYNHPHSCLKVAWPETTMLAESGFVDAFRQQFPDVRQHPGWSNPSHVERKNGTIPWYSTVNEIDRIDYVLVDAELLLNENDGESLSGQMSEARRQDAGRSRSQQNDRWRISQAAILGGDAFEHKAEGGVGLYHHPDPLVYTSKGTDKIWPSDHKAVLVEFEIMIEKSIGSGERDVSKGLLKNLGAELNQIDEENLI